VKTELRDPFPCDLLAEIPRASHLHLFRSMRSSENEFISAYSRTVIRILEWPSLSVSISSDYDIPVLRMQQIMSERQDKIRFLLKELVVQNG
jgi:hypothetical protein